MTIFDQAKQRLTELLKDMQYQHQHTREDGYISGVITGLNMSLEVLIQEEEEKDTTLKTAAIAEWVKTHPEIRIHNIYYSEENPEDLKGFPTVAK